LAFGGGFGSGLSLPALAGRKGAASAGRGAGCFGSRCRRSRADSLRLSRSGFGGEQNQAEQGEKQLAYHSEEKKK
jgi:hypothetical protein